MLLLDMYWSFLCLRVKVSALGPAAVAAEAGEEEFLDFPRLLSP
jgi:hypothetical protein